MSKVSLESSSRKTHVAKQGKATYHATSCKRLHIISSGSRLQRPPAPSRKYHAPRSIRATWGLDALAVGGDSGSRNGLALLLGVGASGTRKGVDPDEAAARAELVTVRPPSTFLRLPPQPFFCVRPEGWPLQLHSAFPSWQCFRSPREGCVLTTARPGIFASHRKEPGRFRTM